LSTYIFKRFSLRANFLEFYVPQSGAAILKELLAHKHVDVNQAAVDLRAGNGDTPLNTASQCVYQGCLLARKIVFAVLSYLQSFYHCCDVYEILATSDED
jgi:hypothetical protein